MDELAETKPEIEVRTAPDRTFGLARPALFAVFLGLASVAVGAYVLVPIAYRAFIAKPVEQTTRSGVSSDTASAERLRLSDKQLSVVKVAPVGYRDFQIEKTATGSIDFNQNMSVQVFTPYQGRILGLFANIGDHVKAGQTLFTIDSPDLLTAESTLIQAAGVLQLANRTLARNEKLVKAGGGAQKDLDQAISDQQTAEGNLKAARNSVRLFGKTDAEMDRMIADRRVDSTLIIPCPISGMVTARSAAPGLFVQPGVVPAPYTVADIATVWMNSYVVESEIPAFNVGQHIDATVLAYPGRIFEGKIDLLGASVDSATRRLLVRSEIKDPDHLLRPGMFARFVIRTGRSLRTIALPLSGVVREGDGTMTAWVTSDGNTFTRRTVHVGLRQNGYAEIQDGLKIGETAVTDGAVFLSNMLAIGAGA